MARASSFFLLCLAAWCLVLLAVQSCLAFTGGTARRPTLFARPSAARLRRLAESESEDGSSRREYLIGGVSSGVIAVTFGVVSSAFVLTREEKVRKAKLCVRSKEFVEDFLADEKRTRILHEQQGVPYEAMRRYLQDPDCIEWPEFVERLKSSRSFWEAGEEYKVG
eukprot:TRINITY_DN21569_c0_g1_i1.p2 TRINITY_DN21569_c0_g1~~TRINITY_DN21569_c0_g1_i1.p2  ORF type:complete len:166 (+),score=37.02 TRINITY_DN21569_c0_g1_i1:160-657(+)